MIFETKCVKLDYEWFIDMLELKFETLHSNFQDGFLMFSFF